MGDEGYCKSEIIKAKVRKKIRETATRSQLLELSERGIDAAVSECQRNEKRRYPDGTLYRVIDKCKRPERVNSHESVKVWHTVHMLEGPLKVVNRCLDEMCSSIRKDMKALEGLVHVINSQRAKTGRKPYVTELFDTAEE